MKTLEEMRQAKREYMREYNRKWNATHRKRQKAFNLKGSKTYRENPENQYKIRARKDVFHALRTGRMTKGICPCGETKVEAHHDDYSRPLKVIWLCRPHHRRYHYDKTVVHSLTESRLQLIQT